MYKNIQLRDHMHTIGVSFKLLHGRMNEAHKTSSQSKHWQFCSSFHCATSICTMVSSKCKYSPPPSSVQLLYGEIITDLLDYFWLATSTETVPGRWPTFHLLQKKKRAENGVVADMRDHFSRSYDNPPYVCSLRILVWPKHGIDRNQYHKVEIECK